MGKQSQAVLVKHNLPPKRSKPKCKGIQIGVKLEWGNESKNSRPYVNRSKMNTCHQQMGGRFNNIPGLKKSYIKTISFLVDFSTLAYTATFWT